MIDSIVKAVKRVLPQRWRYDGTVFVPLEQVKKEEVADLVMKNVEAFAPLQALLHDVLTTPRVVCPDEKLRKKVEQFLSKTWFRRELTAALIDYFIYGDGYLEIVPGPPEKEIVEILERHFPDNDWEFDIYILRRERPELFFPGGLKWVPAKTVKKVVDRHGEVLEYRQIVDGEVVARWKPGELINITAYQWSGSPVYGFTPLEVAYQDLLLLDATKRYVQKFFESGGIPKVIIKLDPKAVNPSSPQYEQWKKEFVQSLLERGQGALVTTAPVDVVEVQKKPADMEFATLYEVLSRLMIYAWDIPPARVYGSQQRSDEYTMLPYFTRVRALQEELEGLLNAYYFSLFGDVSIKFPPTYARNQVRDVVWTSIMYKAGVMSPSEFRERMGLPPEMPQDIEDNPFYLNPRAEPPKKTKRGRDEEERLADDNKVKDVEVALVERVIEEVLSDG